MNGLGVSGDLLRSIFEPMLPVPQLYVEILKAMAELADRNDGRVVSEAPVQIASRAGIAPHLKRDKRGAIVAGAIKEMIKVGIVELVSEDNATCYRFPNRHGLTEIAKEILAGRVHLPPIHIPLQKRRD